MPAARLPSFSWPVAVGIAFLLGVAWAGVKIWATSPVELIKVWPISALGGVLVPIFYWNLYRGTGLVPCALTLAAGAGTWAAVAGKWCAVTIGVAAAGVGVAVMVSGLYLVVRHRRLSVVPLLVLMFYFTMLGKPFRGPGESPVEFAALAAGLGAFSWYWYFRPWFELTCEPVLWWMYKVRAAGPGLEEMKPVGPCLVVANHAAWLDPLFLAKVLPRRTTPMMTSKFYDKPVIGWLVRRFGVIRVPDKALKQDTPEIREAIAALDRGECVVIFPEGFLRRTDDKPLKRFGRGVWQILCERPNTPVFSVWIEGAWGSYCSYWNGPPTKNKKRDFRRPIGVGMWAAVTVPRDVLANHLRTRVFLMNHVLAARTHLGLPSLPAVELPAKDDE